MIAAPIYDKPASVWVGIALLLIGAGMLIAAVFVAMNIRSFVSSSATATGVVIRLNAGGSHPEIRFTTSHGEVIEYPQGGMIFGYEPGQQVRVIYDPARPRQSATIDALGALWFAPLLLLFFGITLVVFGAMAALGSRLVTS